MHRSIRLLSFLFLAAVVLGPAPGEAQSSLSSDTRVKIHRAKLRAKLTEVRDDDAKALEPCTGGNVDIGSIQIERGARVPSDITVVVDGDVINLGDGRGSRICR